MFFWRESLVYKYCKYNLSKMQNKRENHFSPLFILTAISFKTILAQAVVVAIF